MSTRKRREDRKAKEGLKQRVSFLDAIYPIEKFVRVRNLQTEEWEILDVSHAILKECPTNSEGWGEPWKKV